MIAIRMTATVGQFKDYFDFRTGCLKRELTKDMVNKNGMRCLKILTISNITEIKCSMILTQKLIKKFRGFIVLLITLELRTFANTSGLSLANYSYEENAIGD